MFAVRKRGAEALTKIGISFFIITQIGLAQAGFDHFENLREDQGVPTHCGELEVDRFDSDLFSFTYSAKGGTENGFDYEHELNGRQVKQVFKAVDQGRDPSGHNNAKMKEAHRLILEKAPEWGFEMKSDGEVFELLAISDLYKKVVEAADFFITGGVEYSNHGGRVLGELDVVIANRSTCKVHGYGEVKIGSRRHSKARGQVARFRNYIKKHSSEVTSRPFKLLTPVKSW